jgi:hypothetical protein
MRTRALAIAWLVLGLSTWAQAEEGARGNPAARPALALALAQAPAAVRYAEPQSESAPQEHLEKAAVHLEAAGWGALADHVRSLTSLRHKKAHAGGAAEAPRQVVVSVKVFEVEPSKLKNLGVDLPKTGFSVERASGGPFATIDGRKVSLGDALDSLRKDGMAQVLSQPKLVTLSGQPAHLRVGGEVAVWVTGPDGEPVQQMTPIGLSLDVVPQVTADSKVRLDIRWERAEVDPSKTVTVAGKENPVIRRLGFDTRLELPSGETAILASPILRRGDAAKDASGPMMVMLVRPEIVGPITAAVPAPEPASRR